MPQPVPLLGQTLLFAFDQGGGFDLAEFKSEQAEIPLSGHVPSKQLFELPVQVTVALEDLRVLAEQFLLTEPGGSVDHGQLIRSDREPAVLVLSVESDQS